MSNSHIKLNYHILKFFIKKDAGQNMLRLTFFYVRTNKITYYVKHADSYYFIQKPHMTYVTIAS